MPWCDDSARRQLLGRQFVSSWHQLRCPPFALLGRRRDQRPQRVNSRLPVLYRVPQRQDLFLHVFGKLQQPHHLRHVSAARAQMAGESGPGRRVFAEGAYQPNSKRRPAHSDTLSGIMSLQELPANHSLSRR